MEYLRLFKNEKDYQKFIVSDNYKLPNICWIEHTDNVYFNDGINDNDYDIKNYLTIEALEDNLTVSLSINPCQYSLNGTEWNNLQADEQTPSINSGEKIYFKGQLKPTTMNGIGTFTVSKKFNLSGNVMSMIFGDNAQGKTDLTGYDWGFSKLFYNTLVVNISPNFLPAITLSSDNYSNMFEGCTLLVNTPALPATELASYCYNNMFNACTSLVQAPELPATTLSYGSYMNMFSDCTSLVQAPELPATTLADYCYAYMFHNCENLSSTPILPSTELKNACYLNMFGGCKSIFISPILKARKLVNSCYNYMFSDCSNLRCIEVWFDTEPSYNYTNSWVQNVAKDGVFLKSSNAIWNPEEYRGVNGIPEGWTVETV